MLQDEDYIRQTRELILSERTRMIKELKSVPTYKVYPAYANFILLKILKPGLTSYDVFEACIRQGLITVTVPPSSAWMENLYGSAS